MQSRDFISYVQKTYPELLMPCVNAYSEQVKQLAHGTTVIGVCYDDGVILAGDRRMTAGTEIARTLADKVVSIDMHAAIAFSGTMATCMQMADVIRISQNNFCKMNGYQLSLEGKAKYLSQLIRQNLEHAFQGLVFCPLLAGYDLNAKKGFIFSYDIAGAIFKNAKYAFDGSGGKSAGAALKAGWKENLTFDNALLLTIKALKNAAEEDSATGGLEHTPSVYKIDNNGCSIVENSILKQKINEINQKTGEINE